MSEDFTFQISLTVLDHLGRNLYRSFSTVLGEAISNAWDAEATKVEIFLDKDAGVLIVKDNGTGMNSDDFQNKFLKIGFSKRKDGAVSKQRKRPFIGRKGIGKLALLSCASRISIASKKAGEEYVGGTIDNGKLDQAIVDDLNSSDYSLEPLDINKFGHMIDGQEHGTILMLEGFHSGIRNSEGYLRKILALYFRFSILDPEFEIYLNKNKIGIVDLEDLAKSTEFLWTIGGFKDEYIEKALTKLLEQTNLNSKLDIQGFIASVKKPRDLSISNEDERVSVDLFVNGRVRERNILKHRPTARVGESYFYGQLHFNSLEGEEDRFTSSREGVVADDPEFEKFLNEMRTLLLQVINQWDIWRRKHRKDGDAENENVSKRTRKSEELVNAISEDYELPPNTPSKDLVDSWVAELAGDATFNVSTYAECFISENLIRNYVHHAQISIPANLSQVATEWKNKETRNLNAANISIEIRSKQDDLNYLAMHDLAKLADDVQNRLTDPGLSRDAIAYKPVRDACAHTALLTSEGKNHLSTVYANIKGRLRTLLQNMKP